MILTYIESRLIIEKSVIIYVNSHFYAILLIIILLEIVSIIKLCFL